MFPTLMGKQAGVQHPPGLNESNTSMKLEKASPRKFSLSGQDLAAPQPPPLPFLSGKESWQVGWEQATATWARFPKGFQNSPVNQ